MFNFDFYGLGTFAGAALAGLVILIALGPELARQYALYFGTERGRSRQSLHLLGGSASWMASKLPYAIAGSFLLMVVGGVWSLFDPSNSIPVNASVDPKPRSSRNFDQPPKSPTNDRPSSPINDARLPIPGTSTKGETPSLPPAAPAYTGNRPSTDPGPTDDVKESNSPIQRSPKP